MANSEVQSKRKKRSGHVILETALGFMPLCALIFGIADFAMVIYINSCFQNAVREGVRFGITYSLVYPPGSTTTYASQTAAIQAAVEANSGGWLTSSSSSGPAYIQVNYYTPDNMTTPATTGVLPKTVNGTTITALNQPGNILEVKINQYPWNWMVPLPKYTATSMPEA